MGIIRNTAFPSGAGFLPISPVSADWPNHFAPLVNLILGSPLAGMLSLIGIHPDRKMPAFARQTFTDGMEKNNIQKNNLKDSRQYSSTILTWNITIPTLEKPW